MTATPSARERADACPGALQTHAAADGALARVRIPGGLLTAPHMRVLAHAARELGDGALELTSRGNLQVRALRNGADLELAERLAAAGLLPSATHERVRNVLASTLSGRTAGGLLDVRPWVTEVDTRLCAEPALAELPGRFLITLDDGRGDVAGLGGDVGLLALGTDAVALLLGGVDSGLRSRPEEAVTLVLAAARAFLIERAAQGGTAWRLAELEHGPARVAARLEGRWGLVGPSCGVPGPSTGSAGIVEQMDGRCAVVAVVPLGRLTATQADLLAALGPADLQLTPWRSVAVPDLAGADAASVAADLAKAGLVVDADSPWLLVTACTGRPGCAKALADVRGDAAAAVMSGDLPAGGLRQHWAGCERRCGRPRGEVIDVVATAAGYRVGKG